jgi:hypothetical protein
MARQELNSAPSTKSVSGPEGGARRVPGQVDVTSLRAVGPAATLALQRLAGNAATVQLLREGQLRARRVDPTMEKIGHRTDGAITEVAATTGHDAGTQVSDEPEITNDVQTTDVAVQRKVGFEAELTVPSLGPPKGQLLYHKKLDQVTGPLKSFLDGGVPYGTDIGGKGKPIRIDSDHSSSISRTEIVDKLKELGYVSGNPFEPETRLEFVTSAYDELAPGSNKVFNKLSIDLKAQLDGALAKAQSGKMSQLDQPAKSGYKTGVPVMELEDWLGADYATLKPLVTKFINEQTADDVYLQATVGIIPSGIRTFFERAGTPNKVAVEPPSEARQKVLGIVTEVISSLEEWSKFSEHPWVKALKPATREAFMGLLSLIYSYLLGDTLHQTTGGTTSTAKNAVPFLIKTSPWGLVGQAGTHGLKDDPPPSKLARAIGTAFKNTKYLKPSYWIEEEEEESATKEGRLKAPVEARAPKTKFINGSYVDFVEGVLTGAATLPVEVPVGKELPGPDPLPQESGGVDVSFESFGQSGIPLEYRWIRDRYTIANLAPALAEIITDVRTANMKDLDEGQKRKVNAAIK